MAGREAVVLQVAAGAGDPAGSTVPHCFRMGSGANTAGSALHKTEAPGAETSTCNWEKLRNWFSLPQQHWVMHACMGLEEHGVFAHIMYPPTALCTAGEEEILLKPTRH